MSLVYDAMMFAREAHKNQVRKYTGNPYFDHLAEVVGISVSVFSNDLQVDPETFMATAWLHDTVEDCGVPLGEIDRLFGSLVFRGVRGLTDNETGKNRADRKEKARHRLASCHGWIQTIKCADLISNTSSIVKHDPGFAKVYLAEKRALLEVMTKADLRLLKLAREQAA